MVSLVTYEVRLKNRGSYPALYRRKFLYLVTFVIFVHRPVVVVENYTIGA